MAFAPNSTYFDTGDGSVRGCFTHRWTDTFFEFSVNDDDWSDLPHKVWVTTPRPGLDSGFRYARVLKTVAYVVVDEDEFGKPVVEKWEIKHHRLYKNDLAA